MSNRSRVLRAFVALALALLARPALAWQAADLNSWIGKRVFTHYGTLLYIDGKPIDDEDRGKNLARGKDRNVSRVYKVKQVSPPWLWIVAEGSGVKGWVTADRLVPCEQAVEYYTNLIRAEPSSSNYYNNRGIAWMDRKEHDIAIADYNEAIRLDPGEAIYFVTRGNAWNAKKDYDKAIADYAEAIRLDPGHANAYINRGVAWEAKKEYDKAIADYAEAIRLDPGYAFSYYSRGLARDAKGEHDKAITDYAEAIRADGWKGDPSIYATIVGHLGTRRLQREDAARELLDEAERKGDKSAWPYPIVRYLRGEIDEKALSAQATDRDKETEVRCYLGVDQVLKGRIDEARENFAWVKERGTPGFVEIGIAVAELDRLDASKSTGP